MKNKTSEFLPNHQKAIDDLYEEHGVGKTIKNRLAFWNKQYPDGYSISHNPTDRQTVIILELCFLTDTFPQDFPSC